MIKELEKAKTQQLLKETLGWSSMQVASDGFWLNSYTFLKADRVKVVQTDRQTLDGEVDKGPLPMLILEDVVEMVVDKEHKILSVEVRDNLGLWLDSLGKVIKA
ncbi:MAG: hypothetical protein NWE93_11180 [Candidatus Bathyarchaeota archaeon]|nr:hypothetical protein [Candidatus Bathyarchaeota archaeon]